MSLASFSDDSQSQSQDSEKKLNYAYTKRAGPLLLGPQFCTSPVKCVTHCLSRKDGTSEFYCVKVLTLPESGATESSDDIQGKILLHTEYALLKRLEGHKGVVQQYGMYKDEAEEEVEIDKKGYLTGRMRSRICLVMECYSPHDYCPKYGNMVNLQQYVIQEKRLTESLTIKIFYNVVQIVESLHKQNIVHRDLKLGNVVMDKDTYEVKLSNFGLGKELLNENEMLRDQRGSPAYISPEVISGKPYLGKSSDMWALGVVLYAMLYGQFPFYDASPSELFRKIKLAEFHIPSEFVVSFNTVKLLQSLLVLDPSKRLTASQTLEKLRAIIKLEETMLVDSDIQVVPDGVPSREDDRPSHYSRKRTFAQVSSADIEMMLAELSNPAKSLGEKEDKVDELVHEPPKMSRNTPTSVITSAGSGSVLSTLGVGGLASLKVMSVDEEARQLTNKDIEECRQAYLDQQKAISVSAKKVMAKAKGVQKRMKMGLAAAATATGTTASAGSSSVTSAASTASSNDSVSGQLLARDRATAVVTTISESSARTTSAVAVARVQQPRQQRRIGAPKRTREQQLQRNGTVTVIRTPLRT